MITDGNADVANLKTRILHILTADALKIKEAKCSNITKVSVVEGQ
jgi:hypothetical protein